MPIDKNTEQYKTFAEAVSEEVKSQLAALQVEHKNKNKNKKEPEPPAEKSLFDMIFGA